MSAPCPQTGPSSPAFRGSGTTAGIGPYSSPDALAKLDGRTREARLMRETRAELIAHVGGAPSTVQSCLIEQLVQLRLRIATMDRKFAATGEMTAHDSRTYLAWANSYSRLLARIGIKGPPERRAPSLAEIQATATPRSKPAPASPPG